MQRRWTRYSWAMQRNPVPDPSGVLLFFGLLVLALFAAGRGRSATASVPFASHSFSYAPHVQPSTATQAQLDSATSGFYTNWKAAYYLSGCTAGQGRINYDGASQTVSEAHGYGMLIFALMAGFDANAKAYFDAMYRYYKAHPANAGATRLLAWKQDAACNDIEGDDTASDGDLDVAMALLMADRQWGSCGGIDYRAEGAAMIAQLKAQDLDSTAKYVKLGNWASSGNYLNSTRSSDFMPDHYRSFKWASGDNAWNGLIDHTYYLVTATANASTGLLPDFIANPLSSPAPAPANFLEGPDDGKYSWNACRDPWRLATDYLVSGDPRAQAAAQKLADWAKGAPINGNPANVRAGYSLPGANLVSYGDRAFTVPFAVAAMVSPTNQALIDAFWASPDVKGTGTVDYFGDSIKMISMIVLSGNWWAPEAMPDPCSAGTATFTPTRTATRTSTPTASPTMTPSRTRSATPIAAASPTPTASSTASSTRTPSGTASSSPSPTVSVSGSATPSVTPSPGAATFTASPSSSPSASPSPTTPPTGSTETATPSATPSAAVTASHSSSATAVAGPMSSPSATRTGTASVSAGATETPSALPSASASPSATASPDPAATPTATQPPGPGTEGPLVIEKAQPYPQPGARSLKLKLLGQADSIRVKIYSKSWVLVAEREGPGAAAGWSSLSLGSQVEGLAPGLYYYCVDLKRAGQRSAAVKGTLLLLR